MNKALLIPKPCPYCKYKVNYPDSMSGIAGDDEHHCPNCEKRIIFSVPIYPVKKSYLWGKPTPKEFIK